VLDEWFGVRPYDRSMLNDAGQLLICWWQLRLTETHAAAVELDDECLFCRRMKERSLLKERLVYEDEYFHASHHIAEKGSSLLGVVLLQSKRHVNDLSELDDSEAKDLGLLLKEVSRALKETMKAPWTYCYSFLEGVRHVHVFVAARYDGLPREYLRLNIGEWPQAPVGGIPQVNELASRLRVSLSEREIH